MGGRDDSWHARPDWVDYALDRSSCSEITCPYEDDSEKDWRWCGGHLKFAGNWSVMAPLDLPGLPTMVMRLTDERSESVCRWSPWYFFGLINWGCNDFLTYIILCCYCCCAGIGVVIWWKYIKDHGPKTAKQIHKYLEDHGVKKQKAEYNLDTRIGPEDDWMTLSQKNEHNKDVIKHMAKVNARNEKKYGKVTHVDDLLERAYANKGHGVHKRSSADEDVVLSFREAEEAWRQAQRTIREREEREAEYETQRAMDKE